jgi:hypothetical protein
MESPEALGPGTLAQLEPLGSQGGPWLLADALPRQDAGGKALTPALQRSIANPTFGFSMAVGEKTDASVRLSPHSPPLLGIKHQWLGPSRSPGVRSGFSGAISVATGYLRGKNGQDAYSFFLAELGAPLGYRFAGRHLVSLTPALRLATLSGEGLARSGSLSLTGASLGYQFEDEALVLRVEPSWSTGTFSEAQAGGLSIALSLGLRIPRPTP